MSKQFKEFVKFNEICCLLPPRPFFAGGEARAAPGAPRSPNLPAETAARAGDCWRWGQMSPSPRQSPLLGAGGEGSVLRRYLNCSGIAIPPAPLQHNTSL